jgi:hypothetical protein
MEREGPALETLTRRLAECPADFLAEPRIGARGKVEVAAVIGDLVRELGGAPLSKAQAESLMEGSGPRVRKRLSLSLVACWLLADPWFRAQEQVAGEALAFLSEGLGELAEMVPPAAAVSDPDRREELARLCLKSLGLRPARESEAQAADRLTTLSSAERQRVVNAARRAEVRAQKVREEIARRKAAAEADAKAIRE